MEMNNIILREYQKECINTIYEKFKKRKRQLIQLPTGAGKTFIFLNYLKLHSKKAIIICPTKELQEQIYKWAKIFLKDKKIFCRRKNFDKDCDFYIYTAASLNFGIVEKYFHKIDCDTVIIDEAHHAQANTYKNFLNKYSQYFDFKLLGCTATPERLDKKSLFEIFGEITYEKNVIELITNGDLCNIIGYKVKTGQTIKKINKQLDHDFTFVDLKLLDNETRNKILINTYLKNCKNKKTLVFCLNISHSEYIAKTLRDNGIKSECIHGKLSEKVRSEILTRFSLGEIEVLTNCQLLTEGFDEPSIEAIIIGRPTRSKALYHQMIGRGLRNHPGKKNCVLYELYDIGNRVCNFSSLVDLHEDSKWEYPDGIVLKKLRDEVEKINIKHIHTSLEKFDVFEKGLNISQKKPFDFQIKALEKLGIKNKFLNYLEASYLLWKQELKVKYGYNYKN